MSCGLDTLVFHPSNFMKVFLFVFFADKTIWRKTKNKTKLYILAKNTCNCILACTFEITFPSVGGAFTDVYGAGNKSNEPNDL